MQTPFSTKSTQLILRTALVLFFSISIGNALAQVEQIDRIEIPISRDYDIRALYNFGENGLVISTKEVGSKSKRDPDRVFRHYNTNLEETGSYEIEVPFRQNHAASFETDSSVFILNHDTRFGDFTLIELQGADLAETRTLGKLPPKTSIERMFCYAKYAVLYGRIGKRKQRIFVVDLKNGSVRETALLAEGRRKQTFSALDYYVHDKSPMAFLLTKLCTKKTCSEYRLYQFDKSGAVSSSTVETGKYKIANATFKSISADEYIISGTYSERSTLEGIGMFIGRYSKGRQVYFKTYPFTEFERFLDFMPDRARERLERRTERRQARGRTVNYSTRMVLHDILEMDDEYIVAGEVYFPTYRTETRSTPNGPQTYSVFDGYQYSHATIVSFAPNGDKIYDNTFEMYLLRKPYFIKRFIEIGVSGNRINMVYVDRQYIKTKVLEDGETIESEQMEILETGNANDRVRGSSSGEIEYWYKNFFVSYGEQFIKNKRDAGVRKKRRVFFVQKLAF